MICTIEDYAHLAPTTQSLLSLSLQFREVRGIAHLEHPEFQETHDNIATKFEVNYIVLNLLCSSQ